MSYFESNVTKESYRESMYPQEEKPFLDLYQQSIVENSISKPELDMSPNKGSETVPASLSLSDMTWVKNCLYFLIFTFLFSGRQKMTLKTGQKCLI